MRLPRRSSVDVAKRREVGRAVPGDRRRAGHAREDGFGVDARSALQIGGARALDHDEARADARDPDAADRAAVAWRDPPARRAR